MLQLSTIRILICRLLGASLVLTFFSGVALADTVFPLKVRNSRSGTLYVSFDQYGTGVTYLGSWSKVGGGTCEVKAGQVLVPAFSTCTTNVPSNFGKSRVCASNVFQPSGYDCDNAQRDNRTMVELNFGFNQPTGCIGSDTSCTWYDISVIPQSCTNCNFDPVNSGNFCATAGGASYNLPVTASCNGQPTFKCGGAGNLGGAKYPSACGMTSLQVVKPGCIGNQGANCYQAYFWPMWTGSGSCGYAPGSINAPNAYCNDAVGGLNVDFMADGNN